MKKALAAVFMAAGLLGNCSIYASEMQGSSENLDLRPRIVLAENPEIFAEKRVSIESTAGAQLVGIDMFGLDKISMYSDREKRLEILAGMDPEYTSFWDLNLDLKSKLKLHPPGTEIILSAVGKRVNTTRMQHGAKSGLNRQSDVNIGLEFRPFRYVPFLENLIMGFESRGLAGKPKEQVGLEFRLNKHAKIAGTVYAKNKDVVYKAGIAFKRNPFKFSTTYRSYRGSEDLSFKMEIKFVW